ncbi:GNAT family N-acetyltransferase [Novipirellula sp.]|uniref:GNAT family N-acetyltransferase n=1 Tax=Novipirellula sp. TaxID=2795430 RepID=UPI003567545D
MQVRQAEIGDQIDLERIYSDSISLAAWLPDSVRRSVISFAADSEGEIVHVASDAVNKVQGFISVWQPESFIHHLYVAPSFQQQGVGTMLLQSLDTWLPRPWRLKCTQANEAAFAFYKKRGWNVIEPGQSDHGPYWLMQCESIPIAIQRR